MTLALPLISVKVTYVITKIEGVGRLPFSTIFKKFIEILPIALGVAFACLQVFPSFEGFNFLRTIQSPKRTLFFWKKQRAIVFSN